jgi:cytochrome c oxidase cbb3-type subunit IV
MYMELLQNIAGIEIFPVISLVLFVVVFAGILFWAIRADRTELDRHATLPLDEHPRRTR